MPAIDIDRDTAHAAAQRELAKAIYPKASPSQRFGDWVDELLYRLVQGGSSIPGGWFTITVLLIVLAAAVVTAIRVARRTMRSNRRDDYQLFGSALLSAAEHRAIAESHAAADDWSAAVRHRLRAVARGLEEAGVLNPVPGRTANELARDAGVIIAALAAELTRAANVFNDITYGERPGTSAAYQMIADLDDHLRSRSAAGPPEAPTPAAGDSWAQVR